LILLAIRSYGAYKFDTLVVDEETVARIKALQSIAMTPLPGVRQPEKKRPRKKDIAKTWSLERQEEIREERRQERNESRRQLQLVSLASIA
jgi:negative regulator of sigma E activity